MSNKIAVVSYHAGVQGSIINLLDFQQYLKDQERKNVTFYCRNISKLKDIVKKSGRRYTFDVKKITDLIFELPYVVVTDFATLIRTYNNRIPIVCKKLVIFDNVELSYHLLNMKKAKYYLDVDLRKCLNFHKFSSIEFLMPPCNYFKFKEKYDYPANIFFKKINVDMLKMIKVSDNGKSFSRDDSGKGFVKNSQEKLSSFRFQNMFSYGTYYYRKRKELEYFEQFGRLVFEFIMLGKKVEFEKNPIMYEDGMTDYILHYGLEKSKLWKEMGGQYDYKPWEI